SSRPLVAGPRKARPSCSRDFRDPLLLPSWAGSADPTGASPLRSRLLDLVPSILLAGPAGPARARQPHPVAGGREPGSGAPGVVHPARGGVFRPAHPARGGVFRPPVGDAHRDVVLGTQREGVGTDANRGSLNLTNLSTSMSGVYICRAQNKVGIAQCNVTLEVSTGPGAAVVAGAVVGTLVGLGLLAGLVLLYQRRGKALEEAANDIKEDAIAPRTLPWPKGSDTISKNGTLSSVTSARALRPPQGPPRPGALTPTPSLASQVLPSPRLPRTDGAHPQPTSPSPGGVSSSTLSRIGAVPVMVPAQSQAGSLV
ncbi:hypothetical protein HPG69_019475, partial [Diceros bicornis minor]